MYYVQYYDYDLAGKLAPPCGDRAVVILDGRNNIETMHSDAYRFNGYRRPNYAAYQIFKGRSFLDGRPISDLVMLA
jgi:hypothetical protein